jgi:TolB-like protein/DNA-binding SARP family transcriptional activator/Tfp pilus assembly protein PilF
MVSPFIDVTRAVDRWSMLLAAGSGGHRMTVGCRSPVASVSPPYRQRLNVKRLKLFGGLSVETDGGAVTGRATQRRRLALLALLAASARGTSRDRLVAYLWPDANAENGRRFLSDSVYRINQALGGDVIVSSGDDLRLDAQRLPHDLGEFEESLGRGDAETAVGLYTGPFLDGFHLSDCPELERWVEAERARHAQSFASALERLAEEAQARGDRNAIVLWRRLAAHDPYNSRIALGLMRALDAAGERAAAIQHAKIHETLLARELEVEPDAAVRELAEKFRREPARESRGPAATDPPATALVAVPAAPALEAPPALETSRTKRASVTAIRLHSRTIALALIAGAIVMSLGAVWFAQTRNADSAVVAPTQTAAAPGTIAVLPFANLSGDRDNEYFTDGITEELIATLGRVPGVRVASRSSAFLYKNRPTDVREIGRQLGVSTVLEGSVRRVGQTLRISVQLVGTTDGYDLWAETYEREVKDVFTIQEEIALAIVDRLRGTLGDSSRVAIAERYTRDPEVYDLYLKGRFAWHQRTREGLLRSIDHFSDAVSRAPDYARAHVGLADALAVSAFYDYLRPREAYPRAEAAARRAIAIDPTLAAPHATLGYINTYFHLDWESAEREFKQAITRDPGYSIGHQWYGNLLTVSRRFDEAERAFRAAQETDPLSVIAQAATGWTWYYAGKHDLAVRQLERVTAANPGFELAHLWGGLALTELERFDEAIAWLDRAVTLSHRSALTRLTLAHTLARAKRPASTDSARAIVKELTSRRDQEYLPSYEVAKVYLALGDDPSTFVWLRRAIDERSHSRAFFDVDPQLEPIRQDPQFRALLASLRP